MSVFGGPHQDSSSSQHSDSGPQEIPESPPFDESLEPPENQYDDLDETYSDEESDEPKRKKPLTEKEIKAYRAWYRQEINLVDAFETARSGDLSRNLLGFASERHLNLSKQPVKDITPWASRSRWTDDKKARHAVPSPHWTAWPLLPHEVPSPDEGFNKPREDDDYYRQSKRRKLEKPSAELEEVLCDLAARKGRDRVQREEGVERHRRAMTDGREGDASSGSADEKSDSDSESGEKKMDVDRVTLSSPDEESTLSFSVDQDRTRDILQPTIRSIISKVDALMTGLYRSRMNHRAHRSASHDGNSITSRPRSSSSSEGEKKEALGIRDWSEVLGMASLTGWDPVIVGRAAKRCSKLFGEGMSFASLDAEKSPTEPIEYRPDTVPSFEEEEEEEKGWSLDTLLCPHEDCPRNTRRFDLKRRLRWHLKNVHDWDPEIEQRPQQMLGGIHLDGFMRQIPAQPGWRSKDKVKSEKRMGKRREGPSHDADV